MVSIFCQLFYQSFIKLSFWRVNLEFYRNRNKVSKNSFQKPKKDILWLKVAAFLSLICKVKINHMPIV